MGFEGVQGGSGRGGGGGDAGGSGVMLLEEGDAATFEDEDDLVHDCSEEHMATAAAGALVDDLGHRSHCFSDDVQGQIEHFDARIDVSFQVRHDRAAC